MITISAPKGCDLCKSKDICKHIDVMRKVIKDYETFAKEFFKKLPDELKECGLFVYHEPICRSFSEYTGGWLPRM